MTGIKVFAILLMLYPGESIWEELARVPVADHKACTALIRAWHEPAGARATGASFVLQCFDALAPEDDGTNQMRAGYSLEKTLPAGEHAATGNKAAKGKQGAAGGKPLTFQFTGSP